MLHRARVAMPNKPLATMISTSVKPRADLRLNLINIILNPILRDVGDDGSRVRDSARSPVKREGQLPQIGAIAGGVGEGGDCTASAVCRAHGIAVYGWVINIGERRGNEAVVGELVPTAEPD